MRLQAECVPCIIYVRYNELENIIKTNKSVEYLGIILREFSNYIFSNKDLNVTRIATNLFRMVKKLTGNDDPYRNIKETANRKGLELYKELKNLIEEHKITRLELAIKASLLGNALDLGVAGYKPPELDELAQILDKMVVKGLDKISRILENVQSKTILYLLDNAGEAVLDRLLAEELRKHGAKVVGVVKTGSFQNDVTIREASEIGLYESFDKILETGTDASSIFLDEISLELRNILDKADLIIAKGMAHYEYLTDVERMIDKPIVYLLRAKCNPVARALKVNVGDFVASISKNYDRV